MAKYFLTEPISCPDPDASLIVNNAGATIGFDGRFVGFLFSNCNSGLLADEPKREFVISGNTYGPYDASNPMPGTITVTLGTYSIDLLITGTVEDPLISVSPASPYLGTLPIESTLSAEDNCGLTESATASFNFIATNPIANILGSNDPLNDGNWTLDGSTSILGICPTGTALDYSWLIFQSDGITPAVLGTDYAEISGTDTDVIYSVDVLINGTTLVAELTVDNGCGTSVDTFEINEAVVLTLNSAIDSTAGTAVIVGTDGSAQGPLIIEDDAAFCYEIVVEAIDENTGLSQGEIVRFSGPAGSAATPDYSSSVIAVADQAAVTAAFTGTTISSTAVGGFVVDDTVLYDSLTGGNVSGNCYVDYTSGRVVRYTFTNVEECALPTNTSSNGPIVLEDPERCVGGGIASGIHSEYDPVNDEYYTSDAFVGLKRWRTLTDGCKFVDTLRFFNTQLPGTGNEISAFYLDINDRVNGFPTIYYVDGEATGGSVFWKGTRLAGEPCSDEVESWNWTELLTGFQSDTQSDYLFKSENGYFNKSGGPVFIRGRQSAQLFDFLWEDPVGTWNHSTVNFAPTFTPLGSSFTLFEDPANGMLYGQSEFALWRGFLADPVNDDPTVEANWTWEYIVQDNGSGDTQGTGLVAQMNKPKGIYVDFSQDVNGEPRIFVADANNNQILQVASNNPAGASGPGDWDVTVFSNTGAAGWVDGTALTSQTLRPRGIGRTLADGKITFVDSLVIGGAGSGLRLLDPTTGEITSVISLLESTGIDTIIY